ncbi:MAG TPA: hypothetical protein VFL67_20000 [Mycobacterium sp.]|nr:hypothetical protein [Mycobacterium sp.]
MNNARFVFENGRVTRVHVAGKVTFATVCIHGFRAGSVDYFDVTCFSDGPTLTLGAPVTVKGTISKRKPRDPNGKWEPQFVAKVCVPAEEELCPAMPAPRSAPEAPPMDDSEIPF